MGFEGFNRLSSYGFEYNCDDDWDFGTRELALDVGIEPYVLRPLIVTELMGRCPR